LHKNPLFTYLFIKIDTIITELNSIIVK